MISRSQINNFLEIQQPKSLEECQREASEYLNRITLLQEELSIEEKNLRALIKEHGPEVLDFEILE